MTKYDSYEYKPTFETLMELLETGREIEFTYKHNEYFIINSNKHGRALILDTEDLSDYTHDINKFVEMAKIYGITLKELFTNHSDEIEFGTIF
ncbi:hypothetical protein [Brochothrix campestris]|uniref:Uncharacterized protein n=1 Tax=Brochothrix campestris FSL F6-1037 TaxID=1265861 RepID=W7DA76_9LIST|nr:hypothetical protein [Brochothrix campestris]EUJ42163.1 hypothetical protein BCAMP_00150 [Brochothrix campestris FSL F6-1037]